MKHRNLNPLLGLFFEEGSSRERARLRRHADSCEACAAYLGSLQHIDECLKAWPGSEPPPGVWERITACVAFSQPVPAPQKPETVKPVFEIILAILFLAGALFIAQWKLQTLAVWETLKNLWVIQVLGAFGFTLALFFSVGSMIVLALAPIFYFRFQRLREAHA